MQQTVEIGSIFISLAVVTAILFGIALLIIIDHKARIPGATRHDIFSISGIRRSHPIWAWMVSCLLWIIIIVLLVASIYSMMSHKKEDGAPQTLEKLDIERQKERIRHFHQTPVVDPLALGKKPICMTCHGEFPHAKKAMIRTLLNMHTQFVACMTCHTDDRKIPESALTLRWFNYSGIKVSGKPFGTDYDQKTGLLIKTDDFYSKITPFAKLNGQDTMLEITEDAPEAQEFLKLRSQLSNQDMAAIKKSFHSLVNPLGRFCTRCHSSEQESLLPFRELGFSDMRITALTNVNIVGITQKYKEFYLPQIFLDESNKDHKGALFGLTEKAQQQASDEMKNDPRAWWRKSFDSQSKPATEP